MSYIIDFSSRLVELNYLLRLRATPSGIVDLAGNSITNHNVDYTSTSTTLGDGTALKFNGTNAWLDIKSLNGVKLTGDFTISWQVISQTQPTDSRIVTYFDARMNWNGTAGSQATQPTIGFIITNNTNTGSRNYFIGFDIDNSTGKNTSSNITTYPPSSCHFAIVRHNNSIKVFLNGNLIPGYENINYGATLTLNDISIGYNGNTRLTNKYSNFTLDDICVIKGRALWTSSFKPPTKYLPDKWLVYD